MKNKVALSLLFFIVIAISCKEAENKDRRKIDKTSWLLGQWENNSDDGKLMENWEQANDSLFTATSYFVFNKDTLHNEKIALWQNGSEIIYSSVVKSENNGKSTKFKLTKSAASELIFENPSNDYPKKIIYRKITKDSLQLSISGILKGKPGTENYAFSRIKETEE